VKDRTEVSNLLNWARIARSRQHANWWQEPEFADLTEPLRQYIEYESVAVAIRSFAIRYISGPLQIPEYAAALTGSFDELSAPRIDVVLKARQLRRQGLLSRLGALEFYAVYDESVFMRHIGGPKVFLEQMRELHDLAKKGLIQLRMLPFSLTDPIANNASFDLLSLSDDRNDGGSSNDVLYRENGNIDELIEESTSTARHLSRFEQLWRAAANEADTMSYIGRHIKMLEVAVGEGDGT
jgi:uncharacterized protein DUF5753